VKVIVLHGSPRKDMDSDTLAEKFLSGLGKIQTNEITHF